MTNISSLLVDDMGEASDDMLAADAIEHLWQWFDKTDVAAGKSMMTQWM